MPDNLSICSKDENGSSRGGKKKPQQKMNIFQTSLALVATNIGGAILASPYALYRLGLINGVILLLTLASLAHISNMMYLAIKDLTPRKYESIYEISYLLVGRRSIFIICSVMFVTNLCAMIIYYQIIGDTISRLLAQIFVDDIFGKSKADIRYDLHQMNAIT